MGQDKQSVFQKSRQEFEDEIPDWFPIAATALFALVLITVVILSVF